MKLPVAIAVLVLVLAVHSEAEDPTLEERFATFQNQMMELSENVAEKAKTTLEQVHHSDFAVKTRNWFTEQFEKVKQKMDELFPKE